MYTHPPSEWEVSCRDIPRWKNPRLPSELPGGREREGDVVSGIHHSIPIRDKPIQKQYYTIPYNIHTASALYEAHSLLCRVVNTRCCICITLWTAVLAADFKVILRTKTFL